MCLFKVIFLPCLSVVKHHEKGSIIWENMFGTYSIRIVHKQIQVVVSKRFYSNCHPETWGKDESQFEDYIILQDIF